MNLEIPRCECSHTLSHHVRNGAIVPCQHPNCEGCKRWWQAK